MLTRWRLNTIRIAACTVICAASLGLLSTTAMAQSATDAVYGVPVVVGGLTVDQPGVAAQPLRASDVPRQARGGALPFTGLAIGLVGGAGMLLLGVGFAARRASHRLS